MSSCCLKWHLKISRRIYSAVFISLLSIPRRSSRGNSFLRALPPRLCSPEKHTRKSGFSFSASIAPPPLFRRRRQTREDTRSGNISSSSPSVEKYSLPSCIISHSTVSCKIIRTWLEAAASEAGLRLRTTRRPSCWDTSQCRRS